MEDDLLWLNMISAGAQANVDQILYKGARGSEGCLNAVEVFTTSNSIAKHVKEYTLVDRSYGEYLKSVLIKLWLPLCLGICATVYETSKKKSK